MSTWGHALAHPLYCGTVRPASDASRAVELARRTVEYVGGPLSLETPHLHGLPGRRYERTENRAGEQGLTRLGSYNRAEAQDLLRS